MKTIIIKPTSASEDDFTIVTNLPVTQVKLFLKPLIEEDREWAEENDGDFLYDNEELVDRLKENFPTFIIELVGNEEETIEF
jgi:hypothetical protein